VLGWRTSGDRSYEHHVRIPRVGQTIERVVYLLLYKGHFVLIKDLKRSMARRRR
jgi:hypothetical protein